MKPAALFAFFAISALAQPRIQNARLEQRAVSGSLDATIRGIVSAQAAPVWIGYAAPMIPGERSMCCWNTTNNVTCQGCSLEPQVTQPGFPQTATPVRLEGATEFYILLRAEDRKIGKIRQFSIDCNIDAGGLPVYWITGVTAVQSIAFLESLMPAAAPTCDGPANHRRGHQRDCTASRSRSRRGA
jgi:hypothetical protein